MKNSASMSKIQIRAQVLELVLKFKNNTMPSDAVVENCIDALNSIEDKDFVLTLLLKEISGSNTVYDNILSLILFNIASNDLLSEHIFEFLSDKQVPDNKKLFLINLLREQGGHVDYNFIQSCVNNPDEAIDLETKKFLEEAKLSPETQIDFFDFYFTVNENDKRMLIDSIIDDYSGDALANILAPFLYFSPMNTVDKCILEALSKSKSYFALDALDWFIKNSKDETNLRLAKKAMNSLKIAGLRNKKEKKDLFADALKNSKPMGFWYSLVDGNSNISCVFAREKDSGFVQTFFTVFNLGSGALSCFGFDEVTKDDFNIILNRFFKSSIVVPLEQSKGAALFAKLSERSWNDDTAVPYEFVCWRQLTYDIKYDSADFVSILSEPLKQVNVSSFAAQKILSSDIFSNWFYGYKNLAEFASVVDKIEEENILNMAQIELLLRNCSSFLLKTKEFKDAFCEKLTLQAYLLANINMNSVANSLYSICFDDDILNLMLYEIMKRSLYQHFLAAKNPLPAHNSESVFIKKMSRDEKKTDFAAKIIEAIEQRWI